MGHQGNSLSLAKTGNDLASNIDIVMEILKDCEMVRLEERGGGEAKKKNKSHKVNEDGHAEVILARG